MIAVVRTKTNGRMDETGPKGEISSKLVRMAMMRK